MFKNIKIDPSRSKSSEAEVEARPKIRRRIPEKAAESQSNLEVPQSKPEEKEIREKSNYQVCVCFV